MEIFFSIKKDIKDGSLRMLCQAGLEQNFTYVLLVEEEVFFFCDSKLTTDGVDSISRLFLHSYRNNKICGITI